METTFKKDFQMQSAAVPEISTAPMSGPGLSKSEPKGIPMRHPQCPTGWLYFSCHGQSDQPSINADALRPSPGRRELAIFRAYCTPGRLSRLRGLREKEYRQAMRVFARADMGRPLVAGSSLPPGWVRSSCLLSLHTAFPPSP